MKKQILLLTSLLVIFCWLIQNNLFAQGGTISANKDGDKQYAGLVGRVWDPINNPAPGTYIIVTDEYTGTLIAEGISYSPQAVFSLSFLPTNTDLYIFAFNDNIPLSIYHCKISLLEKQVYKLNISLPMPPSPTGSGYVTMPGAGEGYGISPLSLSAFVLRLMTVTKSAKEADAAAITINRLKWLTEDRYDWNKKSIKEDEETILFPIPESIEDDLQAFFDEHYSPPPIPETPLPPQPEPKREYTYLIEIKGGGGVNTMTKLRFIMDNTPVRIEGKGRSDASDGKRIAISTDDNSYFDFQGDYWVDLSYYSFRSFYVTLNSKWYADKDSFMSIKLTFTEPTTIRYTEIDNNRDDLDYVRINQIY